MTDYRKAYGLPERYFLSLGRMVEKKNLATLVAAYAKFCDEWRVTSDGSVRQAPASLVFVGSGELEGALREQARGLGLRVVDRTDWKVGEVGDDNSENRENGRPARWHADETGETGETPVPPGQKPLAESLNSQRSTLNEENRGTVFFYGFRQIEENPVFYALAEAFVLPSFKEEWGLVVNEAMACSLPVIVSRTAGCAEDLLPGSEQVTSDGWHVTSKDADDCRLKTENSLEQHSNGFVFDPKSSDALSEALCRIADYGTAGLQDDGTNMLAQMGRRSREIVAKFSCGNFARQALRAAEAAGA